MTRAHRQAASAGLDGSVTLSTISNAPNALVLESAAVNGAIANGAANWLTISITKVSTPGTLFADPRPSYGLIAT